MSVDMATKKGGKCKSSNFRAQIAPNIGICAFCQRAVDDEIIYGKLYAIGNIHCHYFCVLLSCCLVQKGSDEEGLFGFLYYDILAEVERCKKHKCSYCYREGANLGCSVSQCRKQFHLPCGREKNAVSLFYGNYKSFCAKHAPKQKISEAVAANVKLRMAEKRRLKQLQGPQIKNEDSVSANEESQSITEMVCVICYEEVQGYPSTQTFWPPCCARDAWFHRSCLQRMALSAGMHYLKCPLCNDRMNFYQAVITQGYYVPDRDAAWELEQNAFAEIYERPVACCATPCRCAHGSDYDSGHGLWDMKLCILCGSTAIHAGCRDSEDDTGIYICHICQSAAPTDLERFIASIKSVQLPTETTETVRHGPIMPSRMSLRRTKGRVAVNNGPSTSRQVTQIKNEIPNEDKQTTTESSRLELNLKKPKRTILDSTARSIDNVLLSPTKMIEQGISEKMAVLNNKELNVDSQKLMEKLREKFKKPGPLAMKRRIVSNILEEFFNNVLHDPKIKEPVMEWNSPKKTCDGSIGDCKEPIAESIKPTTPIKDDNPCIEKENSPNNSVGIIKQEDNTNVMDICKSIKSEDVKCNFKHKHIDINAASETKLRTAIDFAIDAFKYNENSLKRKIQTNNDQEIDNKRKKVDSDENVSAPEKISVSEVIENVNVKKDFDAGINLEEKEDLKVECEDTALKISTSLITKVPESTKSDLEILKTNVIEPNDEKESNTAEKGTVTRVRKRRKKYNLSRRKKCTKKTSNKDTKSAKVIQPFKDSETQPKDLKTKRVPDKTDNRRQKYNTSLKRKSLRNTARKFNESKADAKELLNETDSIVNITEININKDDKIDLKPENAKLDPLKDAKIKMEAEVMDVDINESNKVLKLKYKKHLKKKLSSRKTDFKIKIKLNKRQLKLKITEKKKLRKLKTTPPKVLKQYVLKYSPEMLSPNKVIAKPESDRTPVTRKCIKPEKRSDNLIQTNISNFFKVVPKTKE